MNLLSEEVALVATIDPDAYTTGNTVSDYVDMTIFQQAMAVVYVGTLGSSAGVSAALLQATDSSGTGAKAITGKSITELTDAGTDSDKQAIINIRSNELDVAGDFTHVAISVTVATATSDYGAAIYARNARYQPANDNDLSTVDEIVS